MKALLYLCLLIILFGFATSEPGANANPANLRSFSADEARKNVRFWLYTRTKPQGEEIFPTESAFAASAFNPSWPTRITIHGFTCNKDSDINVDIRQAYLKKGNFNVIVVDWGPLSGTFLMAWQYYTIASSIPYIGTLVAEFTKFMNGTMKIPFDDMYLIGHSLGAHIAGYAGTYVKPYQFRTIYALDPAGPEFENASNDKIVDASDAYYVESIQTSTSMGMYRNVGHASFFVNFGEDQPGCGIGFCAHIRAFKVFAESITSNEEFLAKQCSNVDDIHNKQCTFPNRSVARMGGEPSTVDQRGMFYVYTNSESPYLVKLMSAEQISNLVTIRMFTKTSPNGKLVDIKDPASLTSAGFNATLPTRFFVCDYKRSNKADAICLRLKDVYLKQRKYNIAIFNWSSALPIYRTQVFDDDLSQSLADFSKFLNSKLGVAYNKISLVGEGVGANIASYAGSRIGANQFSTLYAIDTKDAVQSTGFKYIESLEASSRTAGSMATIHIRYGSNKANCNTECMHDLAINTFVKSINGTQPLYAVRCGSFQDTIFISNRCKNPGSKVEFGGEPPVSKPAGDYYYQIN